MHYCRHLLAVHVKPEAVAVVVVAMAARMALRHTLTLRRPTLLAPNRHLTAASHPGVAAEACDARFRRNDSAQRSSAPPPRSSFASAVRLWVEVFEFTKRMKAEQKSHYIHTRNRRNGVWC